MTTVERQSKLDAIVAERQLWLHVTAVELGLDMIAVGDQLEVEGMSGEWQMEFDVIPAARVKRWLVLFG